MTSGEKLIVIRARDGDRGPPFGFFNRGGTFVALAPPPRTAGPDKPYSSDPASNDPRPPTRRDPARRSRPRTADRDRFRTPPDAGKAAAPEKRYARNKKCPPALTHFYRERGFRREKCLPTQTARRRALLGKEYPFILEGRPQQAEGIMRSEPDVYERARGRIGEQQRRHAHAEMTRPAEIFPLRTAATKNSWRSGAASFFEPIEPTGARMLRVTRGGEPML